MMIAEKQIGYNSILEKSFAFAVRIVKFYVYKLKTHRIIEPLLKQVLKSELQLAQMQPKHKMPFQKRILLIKCRFH